MIKALIIWHIYRNGEIANFKAENTTINSYTELEEYLNLIRGDNANRDDKFIPHQVVILSDD